jgi:hypothetical protein
MNPHVDMTPNNRRETHTAGTNEDGVDVTLIRWMLSLDPSERLRFLEERIEDILAVRALNSKA